VNECNKYFITCLDELYGDMRQTGKSSAVFNVKIAVNLKRRRFFEAAEHALRLSEKSRREHDRNFDVRYYVLRSYYYLLDLKMYIKDLKKRMERS